MKRLMIPILFPALIIAGSAFGAKVTEINVSHVNGSTVATVIADAPVRFTHQTEVPKNGKPDRMILDLLGATHELPSKLFHQLPSCGINTIRSSQYASNPEKVVRVVFDMSKAPIYRVESAGNTVKIIFTDNTVRPFAAWTSKSVTPTPAVAPAMASTPTSAPATVPAVKPVAPTSTQAVVAKKNVAAETDRQNSLAGTSTTAPAVVASAPKPAPVTPQVAKPVEQKPAPIVASTPAPTKSVATPLPASAVQQKPAPTASAPVVNKPQPTVASTPAPKPVQPSVASTPTSKPAVAPASQPSPVVAQKPAAMPPHTTLAENKVVASPEPKTAVKSATNSSTPTPVIATATTKPVVPQVTAKTNVSPTPVSADPKPVLAANTTPQPTTPNVAKPAALDVKVESKPATESPAAQVSKPSTVPAVQPPSKVIQQPAPTPSASKATYGPALADLTKPVTTPTSAVGGTVTTSNPNEPPVLADATDEAAPGSSADGSSTARFRRNPVMSAKIKGTLVAEFPKRLVVQYESDGNRDPFAPLIDDTRTNNSPIERRVPNVEGLSLVGIINSTTSDSRALLEDKTGYSYILRTGDKVLNGYVLRVEEDRVYFQIFEYGWSRTIALSIQQD